MLSVANKPILLNAVMLQVVMLRVVMLHVIMLPVVLLPVVMFHVVMLRVVAPSMLPPSKRKRTIKLRIFWRKFFLAGKSKLDLSVETFFTNRVTRLGNFLTIGLLLQAHCDFLK